jgi:hypothetical protein
MPFGICGRGPNPGMLPSPPIVTGITPTFISDMPVGERKERWAAMMKILERNDITAWREGFVRALSAIDTRR